MMRILGSIVKLSTAFTAFCESKLIGCSPIRMQVICDELVLEKATFLQMLAHLIEHHPRVPPSLDGTPDIDQVAIDLEMTSSRCEMK
jgi:hypothetical protein